MSPIWRKLGTTLKQKELQKSQTILLKAKIELLLAIVNNSLLEEPGSFTSGFQDLVIRTTMYSQSS